MKDYDENQIENSRRQALKAITAISGGIVATKWTKPVVDSVMLPAHAKTSFSGLAAGGGGGSGGAAVT